MNIALSLAEAMEALAQGQDVPISKRWSELLGVGADSADLYLAMSVIYAKFGELRMQIADSNLSQRAKDLYTGATNELAHYANPSNANSRSVGQLGQRKEKIDLLHLAADALPEMLIPDIQPVTLEELCKELEDIRASAQSADIDPQMRRLIDESLVTLLMVLRSYRTLGPDGAARIYGAVAAELARSARQNPPESRPSKSILQRAIGATKKVGAVVIWASAVVGGADKLLTDGADIASMITGADQPAHDQAEQ